MHLDSFSGPAASLEPAERTASNVLRCLANHPRVSTFDLCETPWLDRAIRDLRQQGLIVEGTGDGYPWLTYRLTAKGAAQIAATTERPA
ncbi:hypothetical protein [Azohydromonas aeria]|uniref:hypothetical protein n=1 Tax=Azohydromonas aeria TaxID=2590212 RepID=UPI0012FB4EB9|nr:hypothetical protein [Azohydromonas aeria]